MHINYIYLIFITFREYYHGQEECISIMKLYFHNILYIVDSIESSDSCWTIWQFSIKRVCKMLISLA